MKRYENYQEDTNLMEGVNKPMNVDGQNNNNNQEQLIEPITFGPIEEQNNYYQQQPTYNTNNYQQPVYNITNNYYQQPNLIEPIMFDYNPIMMEEDMLNSPNARMRYLNNPKSLEALNKVKYLNTMSDGYMTTRMVADYFEIEYRTLQKAIQRDQKELLINGMIVLTGQDLRDYKTSGILGELNSPNNYKRSLILLDRRCVLNIAMLLRDSKIAQYVRYNMLNVMETDEGKMLMQKVIDEQAMIINRQAMKINGQAMEIEKNGKEMIEKDRQMKKLREAYNHVYSYYSTQEDYRDRYEDKLIGDIEGNYHYDHHAYLKQIYNGFSPF